MVSGDQNKVLRVQPSLTLNPIYHPIARTVLQIVPMKPQLCFQNHLLNQFLFLQHPPTPMEISTMINHPHLSLPVSLLPPQLSHHLHSSIPQPTLHPNRLESHLSTKPVQTNPASVPQHFTANILPPRLTFHNTT